MNKLSRGILVFSLLASVLEMASDARCLNKTFELVHYGNDSDAISRLVADVNANGGGKILFPKNKVYEVTIEDDFSCGHTAFPKKSSVVFGFYGCNRVNVDLNGSTIVLRENHSTKYAIFFFSECKSFSLENGTLIGDSAGHDYSPVNYLGKEEKTSHQWGYGVFAYGSQGIISNMMIRRMTGDGIYAGSKRSSWGNAHAKVTIENCEISYCRRNGITGASSRGLRIMSTNIHHIGSFEGLKGASPEAGIDLEFEDGVGDKGKIEISNCSVYLCSQKTITTSSSFPPVCTSFIVNNSFFGDGLFQITKLQSDGEKFVHNCRFVNSTIHCGDATLKNCVFEMGPSLSYVHGTTFINCSFLGITEMGDGKYGCCLVGNTSSLARFERCDFKHIRGRNDNSGFQGFSGYYFPLVARFTECSFSDCSFVIGNPEKESSLSFIDCSLSDGCLIQNRGDKTIYFSDSRLDNVSSYSNQKGRFVFNHCELIQDKDDVEFPLLYFGNHQVRSCTIVNKVSITPSMKKRGVEKPILEYYN